MLASGYRWFCITVLVFGLSVALAAQAPDELDAVGESSQRTSWGHLADLAGHSFDGAGRLVALQWIEPGKTLEILIRSRLSGIYRETYNLDPTTGELVRQDKVRFKAEPDGTVRVIGSKNTLVRIHKDGDVRLFTSGLRLKPVELDSWEERELARWVEQGKFSPAGVPRPMTSVSSAVSASATASPAPPNLPASPMLDTQRTGLEGIVGKTFVVANGGQQLGVVRSRWLEPGSLYESISETPFAPPLKTLYAVQPDGSLLIEGIEAGSGALDAAGLPVVEFASGGKRWKQQFIASSRGLAVVISEDTAKPGKKPKWKKRTEASLREIDTAQADALVTNFAEQREERWAPLAALIDGPWFCVQYEPVQYLTGRLPIHPQFGRPTNRSLPVMRLTSARWITPEQEIEVVSTLGTGRKITDRIVMLADGSFVMRTSGHDGPPELKGNFVRSQYSAAIEFPIAKFRVLGSDFSTGMMFGQNYGYDGKPFNLVTQFYGWNFYGYSGCTLEKYDESKLSHYDSLLQEAGRIVQEGMRQDQEYWADAAQSYAEGQQMLANMRSELFRTVVVGIPQAIADVNQRQAQLDSLRMAAEQESAIKRAATEAGANGSITVSSSSPSTMLAQVSPTTSAAVPVTSSAGFTVYYSCIGSSRRRLADGSDAVDKMFYGIVTASREDIVAAENLFRQQSGSRSAAGSPDGPGSCFPHKTRDEAEASRSSKVSRDRSLGRPAVMLDLSL